MKRRQFIQHTAVTAAGVLTLPIMIQDLKKVGKIGVQLYTVRDAMAKDPKGTLAQVAKIGYDHVELASYQQGKIYGETAVAFKKTLDSVGLKAYSSHLGLDVMRGDWERALADAAALEQQYVVCPWLPESERKSMEQYKRLFELLNKCGETAKKAGLQLAYHNHDFEFFTVDGQIPMEVMLKECDADLVKIELDIYWTTKAGFDPLALFQKYPGRFHLWHVKDMDNTPNRFFTEVGNGTIDWKPIFAAAAQSGMQYFFVEQDVCVKNKPLESIAVSYKYLRKLRY